MSIGDTFPYSVVTVGTPTWGGSVNQILNELISRTSTRIPFSVLQGSALAMGNVPVSEASYVGFTEASTTPAASPVGRIVYYNGNFYLITASGVIQATSGAGLNAAGIGGITGDYGGANPASVRFVDASTRYDFYDSYVANPATDTWAYLRGRGVDISNGAISTVFASIRYAGTLSATYTLPATLPGAGNSVLVLNASGQIEHASGVNTVDNDIYLGGSTKIRHGDRTRIFSVPGGQASFSGVHAAMVVETGVQATTAGVYRFALSNLEVNWRLKSLGFRLNKTGVTMSTVEVFRYNPSTGVSTSIGSGTSVTAGRGTISVVFGTPDTVAVNEVFIVQWTSGDNNEIAYDAELTYDVV